MADALDTITKLINSPPGQLAAGGVLAGVVWKFFERIEAVLTDDTKKEIAVWLLGRKKLSPTFEQWPDTFAKIFDRVFTQNAISTLCFARSMIASMASSSPLHGGKRNHEVHAVASRNFDQRSKFGSKGRNAA